MALILRHVDRPSLRAVRVVPAVSSGRREPVLPGSERHGYRRKRDATTTMTRAQAPRNRGGSWLWPALVFAGLSALTLVVWQRQVAHQRELLARHTTDVCVQTARRAEVVLQARFELAKTIAWRWATHERQDYSPGRFEQLAAAMLREVAELRSVTLVPADGSEAWVVPAARESARRFVEREAGPLLERAHDADDVSASAPRDLGAGERGFFAAIALRREQERLGTMVIELSVQPLRDELLAVPADQEFSLLVRDQDELVLAHLPDPTPGALERATVRSSRSLRVADRSWEMIVAPQESRLQAATWRSGLGVGLLGVALSLGLAATSRLLQLRLIAWRKARDEALRELAERRKAEHALRASEARYRSVFDSSTEGLMVVEPDGTILETNAAACTMHGYPEGGLASMNVRSLVPPDRRHLLADFLRRLEEAEGDTIDIESVDLRRDGGRVDVEVRGARFLHEGRPAVLAVLRDVTDLHLAMEQQTMLSRQILVAQEEERTRLSRDLHDGLGQTLTALRFELDWLAKKLGNGTAGSFSQATALLESSAQELRRICRGLRPSMLDDLGLESAVRQLVEELEEHSKIAATLRVELEHGAERPTAEAALCVYRILQEALTNVHRHAQAKTVEVELAIRDGELRLTVVDDGRGFDPRGGRSRLAHLGIAGMRERAKLVAGSFEIVSEVGSGTRVSAHIPVRATARRDDTAHEDSHDSHSGGG